MINEIEVLYKEIGDVVTQELNDKVKFSCAKHCYATHKFTISLELFIKGRAENDDYGLVFSTNMQEHSHYNTSLNDNEDNKCYLISDLSSGSGEIIASTDEIIYIMSEPIDMHKQKVFSFIETQSKSIIELLRNRYDL